MNLPNIGAAMRKDGLMIEVKMKLHKKVSNISPDPYCQQVAEEVRKLEEQLEKCVEFFEGDNSKMAKLDAVVELVPHIHNPATCEVERKARATTRFDSHGPEPCQMCYALADLEDGDEQMENPPTRSHTR